MAYRIELPQGKYRIELPNEAPDVAASAEEAMRGVAADMNPLMATLVAAGSAVNDVGENLGRLGARAGQAFGVLGQGDVDRYDQTLEQDDAAFRALREERPVATGVGRTAAQIAMTAPVPGGVAGGVLTRMGTGALAGAATGALTSGVDENPYTSLAIGATFGAAAPVVVSGISRAITRLAKKPMQVIVDGQFTDEALEFLQRNNIEPSRLTRETATELRRIGALTREQADNFNLFQQFDPRMNPTMAQLTQTADDFQRQQELFKRSGAVREALDRQETIIRENVDAWITRSGGQARDSIDASNILAQTTQARIRAADEAINEGYRVIRESLPDAQVIRPSRLFAALQEYAPQNETSGGIVNAIWGDLKRRGVINAEGKLRGKVSPEIAEEIRKTINAISRENPKVPSRIASALKNALDDDVRGAVGDDLFRPIRQAKASLERSLERARVSARDMSGDSLLETIISNKASPDDLVPKIMRRSTRVEDVNQLMAFLRSGNADDIARGEQAINELRSAVIRELYEKAASGKTESGGLMFSGKAFAKQLDSIGQSKLEAIFDQQTLTNLGQLRRIGELRTPVQGTALGLGPSGQVAREVSNMASDVADEALGRFAKLTRILVGGRKDLAEIRQMLAPAQATEAAIRASERVRLYPMPGSVGAVTADRLQSGSER